MELKEFINKPVISTYSKTKMFITEIHACYIGTQTLKPGPSGYHTCYSYETINGDPIKNGDLVFEDESLKEPFIKAYEEYSRTEDARWESYGYWLQKEY